MNFIFFLNIFLMWVGGWVCQNPSGAELTPVTPTVSPSKALVRATTPVYAPRAHHVRDSPRGGGRSRPQVVGGRGSGKQLVPSTRHGARLRAIMRGADLLGLGGHQVLDALHHGLGVGLDHLVLLREARAHSGLVHIDGGDDDGDDDGHDHGEDHHPGEGPQCAVL